MASTDTLSSLLFAAVSFLQLDPFLVSFFYAGFDVCTPISAKTKLILYNSRISLADRRAGVQHHGPEYHSSV